MKVRITEKEIRTLLCDLTNALVATRVGIYGTLQEFNRDNPAACNGYVIKYDQEYWILTTIRKNAGGKDAVAYYDLVHVSHILSQGIPCVQLSFYEGEYPNGIYTVGGNNIEEGET